MSNQARKLQFNPPQSMRFAFGYAESKPLPKSRSAQGNRLWQSRDVTDDLATITRQKLMNETKRAIESDLELARSKGDWGKVNRLAALLSSLILKG